jgi:hypothetical protein
MKLKLNLIKGERKMGNLVISKKESQLKAVIEMRIERKETLTAGRKKVREMNKTLKTTDWSEYHAGSDKKAMLETNIEGCVRENFYNAEIVDNYTAQIRSIKKRLKQISGKKKFMCADCEEIEVKSDGGLCVACEDFQNSQNELFLQTPINPFNCQEPKDVTRRNALNK